MKKIIQIVLAITIIVLGYLVWESIQAPLRFMKEKDSRQLATVLKLKDIRTAQVAYKDEYGKFTASFDTLIDFIKNDSMKLVKAEGAISDELLAQGWTEAIAVKEGLIKRDTIRLAIKDTLFKSDDFNADLLWQVPSTEKDSFEMATAMLSVSKLQVNVFEAKVHYDILLHGLEEQEIINLNDRMQNQNNYPGVRVGNIEEPNNNAGNWE